jgi:uncharacterized protein YciI
MARSTVATRLAIAMATLITVGVAAGGVAAGPIVSSAQPAPQPTYYVVTQAPGPAWKPGVDFSGQPLGDHFRYWSRLQSGPLVMGGPLLDGSGGMIILNAPSADAALQIATDDPAVKTGLLIAAVKPWQVVLHGVGAKAPPGS